MLVFLMMEDLVIWGGGVGELYRDIFVEIYRDEESVLRDLRVGRSRFEFGVRRFVGG